ncbi:hypothetical protein CBQ26_15000 [Deinococcus indicus]|uniref:Uncharacterized protein n=1 Tax=Deinococcus indicus TaxID=223556 RepID=A0A246BHD6_9DEIO|nr:hypothetical protein CBQ26_15000 [Deinococcus indicus]
MRRSDDRLDDALCVKRLEEHLRALYAAGSEGGFDLGKVFFAEAQDHPRPISPQWPEAAGQALGKPFDVVPGSLLTAGPRDGLIELIQDHDDRLLTSRLIHCFRYLVEGLIQRTERSQCGVISYVSDPIVAFQPGEEASVEHARLTHAGLPIEQHDRRIVRIGDMLVELADFPPPAEEDLRMLASERLETAERSWRPIIRNGTRWEWRQPEGRSVEGVFQLPLPGSLIPLKRPRPRALVCRFLGFWPVQLAWVVYLSRSDLSLSLVECLLY